MKTLGRKTRRYSRQAIIANFQFYLDEDVERICDGMTLNVSEGGFGFLTATEIRRGQTITVTSHAIRGFSCPKAKVRWVKREPRCMEAGAEFQRGI